MSTSAALLKPANGPAAFLTCLAVFFLVSFTLLQRVGHMLRESKMPLCTPNVWAFIVNMHFSLCLDILEAVDSNR